MDPSIRSNPVRSSPRDASGVRSEINVTPLVDVCLVLLIIFMVVTPLLGNGTAQLPETENPQRMSAEQDDLELTIEHGGRILIGRRPVASRDLVAALRDEHSRTPGRHLVIKADRRLRYAAVRDAMRAASEGGFKGAGLATQRRNRPGAPGPRPTPPAGG
jgi:biopolymer transport protein ExbD